MSDCIDKKDVNKELAKRLASPEADVWASEALLGLLETQLPTGVWSRVSISPNTSNTSVNDEDPQESIDGTDTYHAHQSSAPSSNSFHDSDDSTVQGDLEEHCDVWVFPHTLVLYRNSLSFHCDDRVCPHSSSSSSPISFVG